jgi:hypothetical protein
VAAAAVNQITVVSAAFANTTAALTFPQVRPNIRRSDTNAMQLAIRDNRDFWAGAMLIATGVVAMVMARDYPFGTATRMGPGYFPVVLGALLTLFGLYHVILGLRSKEKIGGNWSIRALIVLPMSLVLFGILMEYAGFVPALVTLVFGSSAAGQEFKLGEVLLLSIGITAFCVVLFIWGLGLPYPLLMGL